MKNFAVIIGINDYIHIKKLNYATQDAEKMRNHFINELQFEENNVKLLVSDSSNSVNHQHSPIGSNIRLGLKRLSEGSKFTIDDNLWFFFSGHGTYSEGLDYIMPLDGTMEEVSRTGVEVNEITEYLKNSGAGNIIMILDACRDEGKRSGKGIGEQTIEKVKEKGIITFFSCSERESSYEVESLRGGAFTHALLEGMRQYATVAQLDDFIRTKVPQIARENGKPVQNPRVIVHPASKRHLILVDKNANSGDINTLKNDAYQALYVQRNLESAEVLWRQVLVLSGAKDEDALNAIVEIRNHRQGNRQNYVPSYSGSKTALREKNENPQPISSGKSNTWRTIFAIVLGVIGQLLKLALFSTSIQAKPMVVLLNIFWFLYWFLLSKRQSRKMTNIGLFVGVIGEVIQFICIIHNNSAEGASFLFFFDLILAIPIYLLCKRTTNINA
jgi:uncharacterized caspase-like protein